MKFNDIAKELRFKIDVLDESVNDFLGFMEALNKRTKPLTNEYIRSVTNVIKKNPSGFSATGRKTIMNKLIVMANETGSFKKLQQSLSDLNDVLGVNNNPINAKPISKGAKANTVWDDGTNR